MLKFRIERIWSLGGVIGVGQGRKGRREKGEGSSPEIDLVLLEALLVVGFVPSLPPVRSGGERSEPERSAGGREGRSFNCSDVMLLLGRGQLQRGVRSPSIIHADPVCRRLASLPPGS